MTLPAPRRIFVRQKRRSTNTATTLTAFVLGAGVLCGLAGIGIWQVAGTPDSREERVANLRPIVVAHAAVHTQSP
jgi:hypothetical protein